MNESPRGVFRHYRLRVKMNTGCGPNQVYFAQDPLDIGWLERRMHCRRIRSVQKMHAQRQQEE